MTERQDGKTGPDFNVRDYGAAGDGKTKDTAALQRAIDASASNGGGRVCVPAGRYLTGTLFLKDHVHLHLQAGSVLLASPDLADYNRDDIAPQNRVFAFERVTGAHLIIAVEATDIAIDGPGEINGNSPAFLGPPDHPGGNNSIPGKRPGQMIWLCECSQIRIADVSLCDAPYWTLFLHGCDTVFIRGVRIRNPPATPNGDGIDVDCCRDVVISDCIIRSGDDSITLRAYPDPLKDKSRVCENVTVTNCVLSTPCNAIRVGVGDGAIRNCVFSNLVITDTRNGICLIGNYINLCPIGTTIENIRFQNLVMETLLPIYLFTGTQGASRIRNITFSDITATGGKSSVIRGSETRRPSGIRLRNIDLEIRGGAETICTDEELKTRVWEWEKGRPSALYVAHADDVTLDHVTTRWGTCDGPWRHALETEEVTGLALQECRLPPPPTSRQML